MTKYLFFHYGPGGNCDIERAWLTAKNPHIDFWDQPATKSFTELTSACATQLNETFKNGQPANIIAHSFGCDLALTVLATEKIKVENLILISPISNLYTAFTNLAECVIHQPDIAAELKTNLVETTANLTKDHNAKNFWAVVGQVVQYPKFGNIYWKSAAKFSEYQSASAQAKPMDFGVWQTVLTDYLINHKLLTNINCENIKIVLGEADPYLNIATETQFWKKIFPNAKIETLSSGHYPHLEMGLEFALK